MILVIEELVARGRDRGHRPAVHLPGAGGRLHHPGHPPGRVGSAALPAVRFTPRPLGTRVPTDQRPPSAGGVNGWSPDVGPRARVRPGRAPDRRELTVVGRLPWSSNLTFLVALEGMATDGAPADLGRAAAPDGETGGAPPPRRVQAGQRRAVAVGLPRRPLPAGGGGLRPVRGAGWGLVPPPWSGTTGPFGAGLPPALRGGRLRAALLHPLRRGGPRGGPSDHVRVRHRRQQRRPQERPRPARGRRPAVGHRPRALLPPPAQAAHGDLGLRRASRCPPPCSPTSRAAGARTCPSSWPTCSTRTNGPPWWTGSTGCVDTGVFPEPLGDRPPYPWPLV